MIAKLLIIGAIVGSYMWVVSPLLMLHDDAVHWVVFAVWVTVVMPLVLVVWRVDWQR